MEPCVLEYEAVKKEVKEVVDEYMKKLATIWEDCGYDNDTILQRLHVILKHNKDLFVEMVTEEEENKNVLIKTIEEYLEEAAQLNEEQEVCGQLGIALREFETQILSEEQMAEYNLYLQEREAERMRLFKEFQETKHKILQLMQDLELVPTLDFEKLVVCEEDSAFKVTKENISLLKRMHQRLECQQEEAKAEVIDLRMKITEIWDRLHEDFAYRDNFLGANKGYATSILKALKKELKRCEELKRRNMKQFMTEIRKELKDWWNKCMVHEAERKKFLPYSSECYTEDLLELHEMEVNKYRTYYEENVNIFHLAAERQQLWDKMVELEQKASDPERLFHNRGGQLLLEEKERKCIQKELPKVEKELLKHIAAYEEENGQPIKFHGECVANIIENQWLNHNNKKENQKKAKKVKRTRLLEVESKLGSQKSTTKRKFGTAATSPLHGTAKKQRMEVDRPCTANRRLLLFPRKPVREKVQNVSATSNITTYTDFQDHLEELDQEGTCRSSVLPERCLREINTPARPPSKLPSSIKKIPQLYTPAKCPRKNLTPSNVLNTPCSVPRNLRNVQNSPLYHKGAVTIPRLTAAKGRLPIII